MSLSCQILAIGFWKVIFEGLKISAFPRFLFHFSTITLLGERQEMKPTHIAFFSFWGGGGYCGYFLGLPGKV